MNLGTWFEKYDALYLLSFTNYYFLSHREGVDPEATGSMDYYPHYQEWLQAFALKKPRHFDTAPLRDDAMNLFKQTQFKNEKK